MVLKNTLCICSLNRKCDNIGLSLHFYSTLVYFIICLKKLLKLTVDEVNITVNKQYFFHPGYIKHGQQNLRLKNIYIYVLRILPYTVGFRSVYVGTSYIKKRKKDGGFVNKNSFIKAFRDFNI